MKTLVFQHSSGADTAELNGQQEPVHLVLKAALFKAVAHAPYTLELSRKWSRVGNLLESGGESVDLEDADFDTLMFLFRAGVEKAFKSMAERTWPDELDRILTEAKAGAKSGG